VREGRSSPEEGVLWWGEREREREIYNTVHGKGSFRRGCENDTM
jgi:hypothetical protein